MVQSVAALPLIPRRVRLRWQASPRFGGGWRMVLACGRRVRFGEISDAGMGGWRVEGVEEGVDGLDRGFAMPSPHGRRGSSPRVRDAGPAPSLWCWRAKCP